MLRSDRVWVFEVTQIGSTATILLAFCRASFATSCWNPSGFRLQASGPRHHERLPVLSRSLAPPTYVSASRVATSLMASSIPKGYNLGSMLDQEQKRQLQSYLNENEARGAPVHSFNPDASPQEKAAIAGKAQSQLQSVRQQQETVASSTHMPLTSVGSL